MTSQSPRIYLYKITFEEVSYYYYGVHKEKYFNDVYWGSPYTHKWCWEFYTPKKQILEIFDYTDEGWLEAQKVETRLIRPFYNTDKWCLNENCGGIMSLPQRSRAGKMGGQKTYEMGVGVHGRTKEQIIEDSKIGGKIGGKIAGKKVKELGIGIFGMSKEEKSEAGKRGSATNKENKTGIFGATKEQLSQYGRKSYELGVGLHSLTAEEKTEICKNAGILVRDMKLGIFGLPEEEKIKNASKGGKVGGKVTSSQKWICLETGYVGNPGVLTLYQNKRCIDTSKRKRIK
jgi:hypothetical protein